MSNFDDSFFKEAQTAGVPEIFKSREHALELGHMLAHQLGLEHAGDCWSYIAGRMQYALHVIEQEAYHDHGTDTIYRLQLEAKLIPFKIS